MKIIKKIRWKTNKNHIKSNGKHTKSYENHIKSYSVAILAQGQNISCSRVPVTQVPFLPPLVRYACIAAQPACPSNPEIMDGYNMLDMGYVHAHTHSNELSTAIRQPGKMAATATTGHPDSFMLEHVPLGATLWSKCDQKGATLLMSCLGGNRYRQ